MSKKKSLNTQILDSLSEHIAVIDKDGVIIYTNNSWDRFTQKSKNPIKVEAGINYLDVLEKSIEVDVNTKDFYKGILSVIKREQDFFYIDYPSNLSDNKKWYTMRVSPIGEKGDVVVSHANITDRVKAEQERLKAEQRSYAISDELEQNKDLFRDVFNSMTDLYVRVNFDGILEMISPSVKDILGYDPEEGLGEKATNYYANPDDRDELIRRVKKDGICKNFIATLLTKDGEKKILSVTSQFYKDKTGKPIGIESYAKDISNLEETKHELETQANLLMKTSEMAKTGYWQWNIIENEIKWDNILHQIFETEIDFKPSFEAYLSQVDNDVREEVKQSIYKALEDKGFFENSYKITTYRGNVKHLKTWGKVELDSAGVPVRMLGVCMDVTEQELKKEELEHINRISATVGGKEYFETIAQLLSTTLNVKYALIGEVNVEKQSVTTLGFSISGKLQDNIEYDLKDTPCYHVMETGMCVFPSSIQKLFPKDMYLTDMGAESYIGAPLLSGKKAIGIIVLMDVKPLVGIERKKHIIQTISSRTQTELERIIAENELKESELKFRELFEKSRDAVLIIENEVFIDCNYAAVEMLNYKNKEEFLNSHPSKLSPEFQPDGSLSDEKAEEMMKVALQNGSNRFEWVHSKSNGEDFYVEVLLTAILNTPDKRIVHTVWRDITTRKKQEKNVKEINEKLNVVISGTNTGVWEWNLVTNDVHFNEEWAYQLGYSFNEIVQDFSTWENLVHPDDIDEAKKRVEAYLKGEIEDYDFVHRMKHKNGEWKHILTKGVVSKRAEDGTPIYFIGTHTDVNKEEQYLKEISEYEKYFSVSMDIMCIGNGESFTKINPKFTEVLGYCQDDLVSQPFTSFIHPEDVENTIKKVEGLANGENIIGFKNRFRCKNGEYKHLMWTAKIDESSGSFYAGANDVTDLVIAQEKSQQYFDILNNSLNEMYIIDADTFHFIDANIGAQKNIGFTVEELKHLTPINIKPDITLEDFQKIVAPLISKKEHFITFETRHLRKDGSTYMAFINLQYTMLAGKAVLIALALDISERINQETELKSTKNRLGNIVDYANVGIAYANAEAEVISANLKFTEILEYDSPDELIGKQVSDFTYPDDLEKDLNLLEEIKKRERNNFEIEKRYVTKNDKIKWVALNVSAIRNKEMEVENFIAMVIDITEKKQNEENLITSEKNYRDVIDSFIDVIIRVNSKGIIEMISPSVEKVLGYKVEEVFDKMIINFYVSKLERNKYIEEIEKKGYVNYFEAQLYNKNGDVVDILANGKVYKDNFGGYGIQSVFRDITDYKQQQLKLKQSEEQYSSLFEKMNEGLMLSDPDGKIIMVNPTFCRMLGYKEEELINVNGYELLLTEEFKKKVKNKIKYREKGKSEHYEVQVRTKSNKILWLKVSAFPYNELDEFKGVMTIFRDVTEQKSIELKREQALETQQIINSILELSNSERSLEKVLEQALVLTLQLPTLSLKGQGTIFLKDENGNLKMTAQKGLPKSIVKKCETVEKGECLCGMVAETEQFLYTSCIGKKHVIKDENIAPHGHYILPIKSGNRLLGVLNVYLEEHHKKSESEISVLNVITNSLGSILAKKQAESTIIDAYRKYYELFKNINDAVILIDIDSIITDFNRATTKVLGYNRIKLIQKKVSEMVHPDDKKKYEFHQDQLKTDGSFKGVELKMFNDENKIVWILLDATAMYDEQHKFIGSRCIARDITIRKKKEVVMSAVSEISATHGGDHYFTEMSKLLCTVLDVKYAFIANLDKKSMISTTLGYAIDGVVNDNFETDLINTPCENVMDNTISVIPSNAKESFPKSQGLIDLNVESYIGIPLQLEDETAGLIVIMDDKPMVDTAFSLEILSYIKTRTETEVKRTATENYLKMQEQRFRGMIEHSSDITVISDAKGETKYVSPSVHRIMGYKRKELVGKNLFDLIHPEDLKLAYDRFENRVKSKGDGDFYVYRFLTKDNKYRYLRVILANHLETEGIKGFVINAQDVTTYIEADKEKYKAIIKAEEKERSRISHDLHDGLGQKIAAANMYVNALEVYAKEQFDEKAMSLFDVGKKLINDATKETRVVSHNIMPRSLSEFGLEQTVKEIMNNYHLINEDIDFIFKGGINGERFENEVELTIFRTIQESISNAIKHAKAKVISVSFEKNNNKLIIEISDNGVGFDYKKAKEKDDKGIGLMNLNERINSIGGKLTMDSAINKGTQIYISYKVKK